MAPRRELAEAAASPAPARWQGPAILAALVAVAVFLFAVVREATPRSRSIPADLSGRLVFATGGDRPRLYIWDLTDDRIRAGPRVEGVLELIEASGAGAGWVGVTQELADGRRRASVLRFLGPTDRAVPIADGDLVAWSADGDRVVTATSRPVGTGCMRELRVVRHGVDGSEARVQLHATSCDEVTGLARGATQTFVGLRGADGSRVVEALGGERALLDGYGLVSSSFTHALFVVGEEDVPDGETADPGVPPGPGAIYLEVLLPQPLEYEASGGPFIVQRFLAWSHDAARAAVVGHTSTASGVFLLDTTVANGLGEPEFLSQLVAPEAMTPSERLGWFAVAGGQLFLVRPEGTVTPLPVPDRVPVPSGPLVWLH